MEQLHKWTLENFSTEKNVLPLYSVGKSETEPHSKKKEEKREFPIRLPNYSKTLLTTEF